VQVLQRKGGSPISSERRARPAIRKRRGTGARARCRGYHSNHPHTVPARVSVSIGTWHSIPSPMDSAPVKSRPARWSIDGGEAFGDALYDTAAVRFRSGLGKDFRRAAVKADISVKPATAPVDATVCQQLFSDLLPRENPVRIGRATIDPGFAGLLDSAVENALAVRPPTLKSRDTPTPMRGWLQPDVIRKARAGCPRLSSQSRLPANRFTAVGYGSSAPVRLQ